MALASLGETGKYAEVGGSDTLSPRLQSGRPREVRQAAVSARNVETDPTRAWDIRKGS